MGTDRCTRTTLVARCCHGTFFGIGFVSTILTLTVMFWIAWCYFGLTILQISDTQRRALVNYSYVSPKPLPTPTTAVPNRSTVASTQESSINSISKSPTTASILRGSSRGESQVKVDKKKEAAVITNLAKGDFAGRERETQKNATKIATTPPSKDTSVISSERESSKKKDVPHASSAATAAILSGSEVEESDDRVYARRVLPSATENRAEEKNESNDRSVRRNPPDLESASRLDISPTKVYATDSIEETLKVENPADRPAREEAKSQPREFLGREKSDPLRRDDIQSSRRYDSETAYREPEFDREYTKRYASDTERGSSRFDDFDDERGSRGRYDKRERGRETDDRYSKGDTRVYPDDKTLVRNPSDEDRYKVRERYPDDIPRRGDDDRYDDRYRDYDEKSRTRDKDESRYRDRDLDKSLPRTDLDRDDERYRSKDEEKYRSRDDGRYRLRDDQPDDERYRSRDDVRYRPRDDDRYRTRDDDRYKSRDDERIRPRDDERIRPREDERIRPRDDERIRPRDDERIRQRDDDRYTSRDGDRYRYRDEERYRSRDDDRYIVNDDDKYRRRDDDRYRSEIDDRRNIPLRSKSEEDKYRSRSDDEKYVDISASRIRDTDIREPISKSSSLPIGDRKPTNSRSQYDDRIEESITDYDAPVRDRSRLSARDDVKPSRLPRPPYVEERYRERDRDDKYRPSRYDEDEVKTILPTRTRNDSTFSRSTLIDSKLLDAEEDPRYDNSRDRIRNDRYYEENERNIETRIQDSRSTAAKSESSRRYADDTDRYRTRLPNEKSESSRRYVDEIDRYRTRLPIEKTESSKIDDRREEVVLDHRSYTSEEDGDYRKGVSRTRNYYEDRSRSPTEDTRRRYIDDESYSRRDPVVGEEVRKDRVRDGNSRDRSRDRYDDEYRKYDDKYVSKDEDRYPLREGRPSSPARKYDAYPDDEERTRRRDSETRTIRTEDSRIREELMRPSATSRNEERYTDDFSETKSSSRRRYDDGLPYSDEYDIKDRDSDGRRYSSASRRPVISREPVLGSSMSSREPSDVVTREKRFQNSDDKYQSSRVISNERSYMDPDSDSTEKVRPLSAKDVIEAAIRHSENSDQNSRKVHYPVFDPRASNLTSPEIIRPSERRGTTITARKRRSA